MSKFLFHLAFDLLLLLILLLVGKGEAGPVQWSDILRQHQATAPLPDSVSVLIFSGFEVDRIAVTAPAGSLVNGRESRRRTHTITYTMPPASAHAPAGESLMLKLDGTSVKNCIIVPPPGKVLDLAFGSRRKRLRGTLRIEAAEDRLGIVGRMALRDYLAAALGSEASSSGPMEFLVALSVVQRNYLVAHQGRHAPDADLCDVTHCQLADFTGASSRIQEAVERAMAISLDLSDALPCYYSVNCGGSTLTPAQIWRAAEPGYANVACTHCRGSERYRWERRIDASPGVEEILRQAPAPPFVDDDFKIRLGRVAGFNKVLSNSIDRIERRGRHYLLAGRGFGHRVGLCMEGGRQLALQGRRGADILRFYFPTARIRTQP